MDYLLDFAIAMVLLLFIYLSIKRGLAAELKGITGWIIILLLSLKFGALVGDYFSEHVVSISTLGTYVGFIVLAVVLKLFFILICRLFESKESGVFDKIVSGIIGFIKGALLISIVFIILSSTHMQNKIQPYVEQSKSYRYFYGFSTEFVNVLTRFVPQLDNLYDRMLNRSSKIQEDTSETLQEKVEQLRKRSQKQGKE